MAIVHQVLLRLEEIGFTINPPKCAWALQSRDYLGFLLTTDGIKPLPKKIETICRNSRSMSRKNVRSFVGLINYYKDMWPRRAYIMASLTELCGAKSKSIWTDAHENVFNLAKKLVAEDVLLMFPNHELPFAIFTDARNIQIRATIKQHNLPIAYF